MENPTKTSRTNQPDELTDELIKQIKAVRDTGKTNMFDFQGVMYYANELNLFELISFLSKRKNHEAYVEFILHGKPSSEK